MRLGNMRGRKGAGWEETRWRGEESRRAMKEGAVEVEGVKLNSCSAFSCLLASP